jgi:translation initiation factor 1A
MKKDQEMSQEEIEISRIRVPHEPEVLGVVEMMVGGDRMRVKCDDGLTRLVRIPGRLRKKVWTRPGDLILVEPWKLTKETKGDLVFRYTSTQASWMKRKGFIKNLIF